MAVSIQPCDNDISDKETVPNRETKADKILMALSRYVGYLGLLAALTGLTWLIFL